MPRMFHLRRRHGVFLTGRLLSHQKGLTFDLEDVMETGLHLIHQTGRKVA